MNLKNIFSEMYHQDCRANLNELPTLAELPLKSILIALFTLHPVFNTIPLSAISGRSMSLRSLSMYLIADLPLPLPLDNSEYEH